MQKTYLAELRNFKKAYVGGRLGNYKYYDMDDAIASAFASFDELTKKES